MSIEGMWCFISGEIGAPVMESGGVVILDTQRIYGGDSVMAFKGSYAVEGLAVRGSVESWGYNPAFVDGQDVFGEQTDSRHRMTEFEAVLDESGYLVGHLRRNGTELPLVLMKLSDLH